MPGGLRWRLAGWVTLVTLLCTAIVFVAVYRGTGAQLRRQIDKEIAGDAAELAHNLAAAHARTPRQLAAAATRYIARPAVQRELDAAVRARPRSGPEHEPARAVRQPAPGQRRDVQPSRRRRTVLARTAADAPLTATRRWRSRTWAICGCSSAACACAAALGVTVGVGEPLASVAHAQRGVARAFILAGLLALAGALLASYLIGSRVSRPLRRMAAVAARVDAGDLHPRIHGTAAARATRCRCWRTPSTTCSTG